jgi:hypothetical protein
MPLVPISEPWVAWGDLAWVGIYGISVALVFAVAIRFILRK